jgi:FeS assembly SUF system protein
MDEASDIEHLKVHKIEPERPRHRLPTVGQGSAYDPAQANVDEAYGGSGEAKAAPIDVRALEERVVEACRSIFDPEIPVNIYELGLIYGIDVTEDGAVDVRMTLTAPACPVAGQLVTEVAEKVGRVPDVSTSHVTLVWDPPWSPDRMTDEAKLELGLL